MLICTRQVTIINKLGLHARAAAKLVTVAAGFASEIYLLRDSHEVNAKSIMGVMMLAAARGTQLEIRAEGDDAEQALEHLDALIQRRFDETE